MPATSSPPRVVCTVPTYDEAENILDLARELLAIGPHVEVLVIDDDSPDGTWKLVRDAGRDEPRLHLLHRTTDRGRGRAGRDGFVRALELGADVVVEMDADFSHHPRFVPALVERLCDPERPVGLVLGSRAVGGGSDLDRGLLRRWITLAANLYIRVLLGVRVGDCNSGFRCLEPATPSGAHPASSETFSAGAGDRAGAPVQDRASAGIAHRRSSPIEFVQPRARATRP